MGATPGFEHPFSPLRSVPHPTRFYEIGSSFVVEWSTPGRRGRVFRSRDDLETALQRAPSLEPAAFIFHSGRCGSTLLARLLETDGANRVFIEPNALLQFLETARSPDLQPLERHLDVVVRSHGVEPQPAERRLIIKLGSLAVCQVPSFRACFPNVPFIYLLRNPAEVVASLCHATPKFLSAGHRWRLGGLPGSSESASRDRTLPAWCSAYVNENLRTAWRFADEFDAVIDYADYARRYLAVLNWWKTPAGSCDDSDIARVLGAYTKHPSRRFSRVADREKLTREIEDVATPMTEQIFSLWQQRCRSLQLTLGPRSTSATPGKLMVSADPRSKETNRGGSQASRLTSASPGTSGST